MTDHSNKPGDGVDELLAPPPFGVAETTGEQLLPIATSMESVLDRPLAEAEAEAESRASEAAAAAAVAAEVPETPPPSVPPVASGTPSVAPAVAPEPVAAVEEPASNTGRNAVIAVVALALLGGIGWFVVGSNDPAAADGAATDNTVVNAGPAGDGKPASPSPEANGNTPTPEKQPAAGELPTTLEALRNIPYADRHAALKVATGDVPVDLHVGLDLIQAGDSETPCRTFSDALSTIESSPDPDTYAWALEEAVVPTSGQDTVCARLGERLAALSPTPTGKSESQKSTRRGSRANTRPKPRRPKPEERPTAAPPEEKPKKTPPPTESPKRAPSVATKLDDDLRGLGE